MQQFDMYLTTAMENGFNYTVVSFAIKLVYKYLFDENTTNALLEAKYVSCVQHVQGLFFWRILNSRHSNLSVFCSRDSFDSFCKNSFEIAITKNVT